jgi:hydrogenase maturation protease
LARPAAALVVGYGNPLRADDGLGWRVVERLAAEAADGQLEVVACQQLTPELAERVSQHDPVIFVDARAGRRPGRVTWRAVEPAGPDLAFSHQVEPGLLLAWSGALYGSRPAVYLLTVEGADFGFGQRLSTVVERALPKVLRRIGALLAGRREPDGAAGGAPAEAAGRPRAEVGGQALGPEPAGECNGQAGPAGRCTS